ncbi:hypothetical protein SYJ56_00500 [Algoriphagus sp. D3-2-R+10]|uniref:hypothetical protein n=1 Tax=Algoriphagus aurantiacus TaxID=3103948 RepID=UPI002B3C5299|nr:hypothetical protein [Algoriphagus sp. D3-2-R+10]MEB2773763.1 hypothetical protein [Algoriphagus sp. D3-2-R+10]
MKVEFNGIPVSKVYYLGQTPQITNGCFEVINNSKKPFSFIVMEAVITDGKKELPINEFHLYKLPDYVEIDQKSIHVGEDEGFKFDLSFPFISVNGFNKEDIKVCVSIKVNDEILRANSLLIFDLRAPK